VRALDRALISGDYVIPLFYLPRIWVAYWKHLQSPSVAPLAGVDVDTWWSDRTT
jgi:peptide/nickel transport system substrate-binding protein